jgi:hypothetical protein
MSNDNARLACFDKLSKQAPKDTKSNAVKKAQAEKSSSQALAKEVTKAQTATNNQVSQKDQVESFGLVKKIEPKDKVTKIVTNIKGITKNPYGKLVVTLDNGQVWRQIGDANLRLKPGQQVYVEEGALGSFFLGKESLNTRIRVKRSK